MPFDVKFEDESIPKGQAVHVDGIGAFDNGETRQVTDEENEQFMARNQTIELSVDPETNDTVVKIIPGLSVVEALKKDKRFTVSKIVKAREKTPTHAEGNK